MKELVNPPQEIGRGLVRAQPRNAERRRHLAHSFAARLDRPLLGFQNSPDSLDRADRIDEARAREDQRELLAAKSRHLVLSAHILRQDIGEQAQQAIADKMAEPVVDMLESIDVGEGEAEAVAQPSGFLHLLREAGVKEAAIADCGHYVAQTGLLGPLEVRLQLHHLQARTLRAGF